MLVHFLDKSWMKMLQVKVCPLNVKIQAGDDYLSIKTEGQRGNMLISRL